MTQKVKPIPEGYHSVTPHIIINGASKAIEFYKKVFNATELFRMPDPQGKIAHAEIKIGNSIIMLADEYPEMEARSPQTYGGSPITICLYVEDADTIFNQAIRDGAQVVRPLKDQFYGDRSGTIKDPFGHKWTIATHIEDVTPEEMDKRCTAAMQESC